MDEKTSKRIICPKLKKKTKKMELTRLINGKKFFRESVHTKKSLATKQRDKWMEAWKDRRDGCAVRVIPGKERGKNVWCVYVYKPWWSDDY